MKLFKKKREALSSDELAGKIAGKIISVQQRVASYLNSKAGRLSGRKLLYGLMAFCLIFGGYLLYLLYSAIS
ncbi:hypothetical protein [Nubsella zeaxanthinifaciens]|uniref:hypothetical protein n=1 Tax=Nubsella zeaxanthinifaciens TaxID=392412 RepID=UPI000DE4C478|nr:hypothetical protein [Nubsella zeaxanthinifaciens]